MTSSFQTWGSSYLYVIYLRVKTFWFSWNRAHWQENANDKKQLKCMLFNEVILKNEEASK